MGPRAGRARVAAAFGPRPLREGVETDQTLASLGNQTLKTREEAARAWPASSASPLVSNVQRALSPNFFKNKYMYIFPNVPEIQLAREVEFKVYKEIISQGQPLIRALGSPQLGKDTPASRVHIKIWISFFPQSSCFYLQTHLGAVRF